MSAKALQIAFEKGESSLSLPIPVRFSGTPRRVIVQVKPVKRGDSCSEALVLFIEGGPVHAADEPAALASDGTVVDAMTQQLQEELQLTRDRSAD